MTMRPSHIKMDLPPDFDFNNPEMRVQTWVTLCATLAGVLQLTGEDRGGGLIMLTVDMMAPYGTDYTEADKAFRALHGELVKGIRERDEIYQMREAEDKAAHDFGYQPERSS